MKFLEQICLLLTCFAMKSEAFDRNNPRHGFKSNSVKMPFLGHKISFSILPSLHTTIKPAPSIDEKSLNSSDDDGNIFFASETELELTTKRSTEKLSTTELNVQTWINRENITRADNITDSDLTKKPDEETNKDLFENISPQNFTAVIESESSKVSSNRSVINDNNVTSTILTEKSENKTNKPNINSRFGIEEADYLLVPVGTIQEHSNVNSPTSSNSNIRVITPVVPVGSEVASNGYQGSLDNVRFPDDKPQIFRPINQLPLNQAMGSSNQNIAFPLATTSFNNNAQYPTNSRNEQISPSPILTNPNFVNNVQNLSPPFSNVIGNQMQTFIPFQNNVSPVNGINNQANVQVPNNHGYNTFGIVSGNSVPYNNFVNNVVPQNQVYAQSNVLPIGSVQNSAQPANNNPQYYTIVTVPNNMNAVQSNGQLYLVNPNQVGTGTQLITQPGYNVVTLNSNPNYATSNIQTNQLPINNNNLGSVVFPQNRNYVIVPPNQVLSSNVPLGNNQQLIYAVNQ